MSSRIGYTAVYSGPGYTSVYPGYIAGRAGGANPAAGHGTTPGPGPETGDLNNH